jgi:hypothetical protein
MQGDSNVSEFNIFYIAGIGCGDSGEGSAYAWIEGKTKESLVEEFDGMTANAAKYEALFSVVRYLPPGSEAYVMTDSAILYRDFNGFRTVRDDGLTDIGTLTTQLIFSKKLSIHIERVKRNRNPAWKMLVASRQINQTPETN